jgi:hypothetical protein
MAGTKLKLISKASSVPCFKKHSFSNVFAKENPEVSFSVSIASEELSGRFV